MAVTQTDLLPPNNFNNLELEVKQLVWTSTTATVEVTTGLSEIYAYWFAPAYGANASHADGTGAYLELDETATAGVITPSGGVVTVNRLEADDATALTGQNTLLFLIGKS